jgi:hypothetical protein
VVEATGGVAGAHKAGSEGTSTETGSWDGTFTGGMGPGDVGLIECVGGDGGIGFGDTGLGEEEGEGVLVLVEGDGCLLNADRLGGRGLGVPELKAVDGPVEDRG